MAQSGRINLSVTGDYGNVTGWIEWSESSINTTNNTSVVTAILYYANAWSTDTYSGTASPPFYLTINGNRAEKSGGATIPAYSTRKEVFKHSVTVTHDTDGAKSITISGGGGLSGTQDLRNSSGSGTAVLTTIPRATQPSVNKASAEIGSTVTISLQRASSTFTHNLWYKLTEDNVHGYELITRGAGTSLSWKVPMDLCKQLTNAESASLTILCETYNGSTLVDTGKTTTITVTVPSNVKPTASMEINVVSDNAVVSGWGVAVLGYSKIQYAITGSGQYGSTIASYEFTANGQTLTAQTGTTKELATAGNMTARCRVKDSRGRWSDAVNETVYVYDYNMPTIKSSHAYRCDKNGVSKSNGTYLSALCDGEISSVDGNNQMLCRVRFRLNGGVWGAYTELQDNTAQVIDAEFDVSRSYEVEISVTDSIGNSRTVIYSIPTDDVAFNLKQGGHAAAFGKYAEHDGELELAENWGFRYHGAVMVDHVVEQGSSGVWTWRKWHSGVAECWMRDTRELTHYTTVGDLYGYVSDPYDYPVSFTEVPTVVASARVGNGFALCSGDFRQQTDHFTFYILSTASGTKTCTMSCCVRGRWK